MVRARKAVLLVLIGWLATVVLAFAAGYWMIDRPIAIRGDGDGNARGGELSSGITSSNASTPVAGPGKNQAGGPPGDSANTGVLGKRGLARILQGSTSGVDWQTAALEAGLLVPEEARLWAESVLEMAPGRQRDRLLGTLLSRLATREPQVAMQLAGLIGSVAAEESARRRILEAWGRGDPAAAQDWMEENARGLPGRMRSERFEAWMEGFAQTDPIRAFEYVASLSEQNSSETWLKRQLAETVISSQVKSGNIEQALLSLESLPDGPVRTEAMEEFYSEWAQSDPSLAADHFLANRVEGSERVAAGLVRSWAETDPEAAAGFVASLEREDPAFEVAVSSLVERWSRFDLDGPAAWLNELPPSPEIDRAVAVFSVRASREDPAGAMSWAESIASEQTRTRVMQRVAGSWRETDPAGFYEYLQQGELDEETVKQLQDSSSSWGGRRFRD